MDKPITQRQFEVLRLLQAHFTTTDAPYKVPGYLRVIIRNLAKKSIVQFDPSDNTAIFIGDNWKNFIKNYELKSWKAYFSKQSKKN